MIFEPGIRVRHYDNPGRTGTTLIGERITSSGIYRKIRWDDGNVDFVSEDQLEILEDNANPDPIDKVRRRFRNHLSTEVRCGTCKERNSKTIWQIRPDGTSPS